MEVETTPLLASQSQSQSHQANSYDKASNSKVKEEEEEEEEDEEEEVVVVDFAPYDPTNPVHFPKAYKSAIVTLLALMAFVVTFTCIGIVPVASRIVDDLSPPPSDEDESGDISKSKSAASVLLVTIWELGEAAGPLLIAPLSEIYGRYPIVNIANLGFIIVTAAAAACPEQGIEFFIVLRALTGFTVMSNVLNPAVVGDLFEAEQRGQAMSLIFLTPLIGGAVGPLIAGAITERLGSWRAVLWLSVILASVCELLFLTCFRETYAPTILRKKAVELQRQRESTQQLETLTIRTAFDDSNNDNNENEKSSMDKLVNSLFRPGIVFFSSPLLMAMSLYGAVGFTYFYIMSTTLPNILRDNYGLSPSQVGWAFLSFSAGSLIAVTCCNLALDRIYVFLKEKNRKRGRQQQKLPQPQPHPHPHPQPEPAAAAEAEDDDEAYGGEPEFRLPLLIVGGLTLPVVAAAYGWIAEAGQTQGGTGVPLIAMQAVLVALGISLLFAFMPLLAYVVDATGVYSASAITAVIVTRCLIGTFLPLAVTPLVARFGYGLGMTIVGSVMLSLAPIPIAVYFFGRQWRQGSPYTRDGH